MMPAPPVLCYHRVGGPLELGVTRVTPETFKRQMQAIAKAGWRTLSLTELATSIHSLTPPPPHAFFLSFDDGYTELAEHAYPVLRDLGFTATTFLITDYVGRTNGWDIQYTRQPLHHLDWAAAESWQARGLEFASHTATHARLTWAGDAQVADELGRSRETLVTRLGNGAGVAVAYPFGAVDARVAKAAGAAGYRLGFDGVQGVAGDPLRMSRVPVYVWDAGDLPVGMRDDAWGAMGQVVAYAANRAAIGTTIMKRLFRRDAPA